MKRVLRIFFFALIGFAVILGLFLYPASELARWMGQAPEAYQVGVLLFLLFIVCGFLTLRRARSSRATLFLSRIVYLAFGFLVSLLIYVLLLKTMDWIPYVNVARVDSSRGIGVFILTAFTLIVGYIQARHPPRVKRVEVPLTNLPKDFDGLRIVQVSDLHVSEGIRRDFVARVVRQVQSLEPDLVALTGDFADGTVEALRDEVAPLSNLKSKYGSYFVPGNHEYYWNAPAWIEEQRRLGARVLLNEHVVIRSGDGILVIGGGD